MFDRLLIIGWDGATWEYIDPLIKQGRLTNLQQLLEQGARTTLKSTIPAYTNVAWPALVTGLHPAKTGIFGGARRQPGSYNTVPTNLTGYRGVPVWKWANRYGYRAGVINVPMTYPATELDGYMVTGFDSPRQGSHRTYPAGLLEEWTGSGHPYHILDNEIELMGSQNPHHNRGDLGAFVDAWVQLTREQGHFIRWLWHERPVPLLFSVFSGTDSINHRTRDFDLIARVYEATDEALGQILNVVDDKTLVCLVSDHGSTPAYRYIALYRALAEEGWLHFRPQVANRFWKRLPAPFGPFANSVWDRLPSFIQRLLSWPLLQLDERLAVAQENIDWNKTTVYTYSGMGALYLNVAGREPNGIIAPEDIATVCASVQRKLMALHDTEGHTLLEWVQRGHDIYPGADPADCPPDLVFRPARVTDHVITGYPTDPLFRDIPESGEYGTHTPDGIFVLAGPGVRRQPELFDAEIVDVIPTVLAALGLPIPDNVDGRPLVDLFKQSVTPKFAPAGQGEQGGFRQSAKDAEEVMERLRELGYL